MIFPVRHVPAWGRLDGWKRQEETKNHESENHGEENHGGEGCGEAREEARPREEAREGCGEARPREKAREEAREKVSRKICETLRRVP